MTKKTFVKGAVILGAAGVVVKMLGAMFRIPLGNIIGDTGMGYYQTAYPIYVLLLSLTNGGLPTAVSRLVSERTAEGNHREAYRVFKISFGLMAGIGVLSSLFLLVGAPYIASFSSMKAVPAIRAIAPALIIVPLMSAFRGYFQGQQDMMPTAVSRIFEQLFRVALGLTLAVLLVSRGLEFAAAGASFGATAGGLFGLSSILIIFMLRRKGIHGDCAATPEDMPSESWKTVMKKLVVIAVPITIGAAIMPVMSNIDLLLVNSRLTSAGFTPEEANSLYGQLSGFAASFVNFPQELTQGIALSIVPAIAAAYQVKDTAFLQKNIKLGLRMAMLIGMPCAAGLFVLAKPIMMMLYPLQQESAVSAAGCLAVLALGVVFLSAVQALTGMLQGIGRQMVPVANLAVGAVFKVIITFVLTAVPFINVRGAAAGTVCAYIVATVLNYRAIRRYADVTFDLSLTFVRPALSAGVMGLAVFAAYRLLGGLCGNVLATLISVGIGVCVYAFLLFALKAITMDELREVPKAGKLVRLLEKIPGIGKKL
ncbi:MAG: polysaccharide biosynthesis protein [Firmicutes bacterium]|nr:polysaccharide biosynthesis protein [Bacillota bacterium]